MAGWSQVLGPGAAGCGHSRGCPWLLGPTATSDSSPRRGASRVRNREPGWFPALCVPHRRTLTLRQSVPGGVSLCPVGMPSPLPGVRCWGRGGRGAGHHSGKAEGAGCEPQTERRGHLCVSSLFSGSCRVVLGLWARASLSPLHCALSRCRLLLGCRIITVVATIPHRTRPWSRPRKLPQMPPSSMTKQ